MTIRKHFNKQINLIYVGLAVVFGLAFSVAFFSRSAEARTGGMKTIVIDPGHGGYDTGIRWIDGRYEKDVTLALARMVAARLEGRHRIVLTRTGDYFLESDARAAKANRAQADLFVSIHVAGGWSGDRHLYSVGFFKRTHPIADTAMQNPVDWLDKDPLSVFIDWDRVQHFYYQDSRAAAVIFRDHLAGFFNERGRVVEAGLDILAGADMPAVMIEIGLLPYLTGSSTETVVLSLARLADVIGQAVEQVVGRGSRVSPDS